MKPRLAVAVTAALALAAPATASAAELTVESKKPCYGSGDTVRLVGTGFAPGDGDPNTNEVLVTSDGETIGETPVDANGAFGGSTAVRIASGRRTKTYTATDIRDPTVGASAEIRASARDVGLRPQNGPPSRVITMTAKGFTEGRSLWVHIVRGSSKRNIKLGQLKGACHDLRVKRRLLRQGTPVGVYIVQFDTNRRYRAQRPLSVIYTITVRRVFRPAIADASWSRVIAP